MKVKIKTIYQSCHPHTWYTEVRSDCYQKTGTGFSFESKESAIEQAIIAFKRLNGVGSEVTEEEREI